jgi:hypothetical protein
VTGPSRAAPNDGDMDVVAIALGIFMFVALLALIEGIDRI